jgi:hypothetical protein
MTRAAQSHDAGGTEFLDLADAERIFLEDWFAGRELHGEDSERAREVIEEKLIGEGMSSWSPGSEYEQDDVLGG